MGKPARRVVVTLAVAAIVVIVAVAAYVRAGRRDGARPLVAAQVGESPDSAAIAQNVYRACGALEVSARSGCYERELTAVAAARGLRLAMRSMSRLGALDPAVAEMGHGLAHMVGMAAGRATSDVAATFASCTEVYESGCFHGVLQSYFEAQPSVGAREVNAVCAPFVKEGGSRWLRAQCLHGLGHGLLRYHRYEIPRALASCDLLDLDGGRNPCYSGVFMENIVNAMIPVHGEGGHGHAHGGAHGDMHGDMHTAAATPAFKALDASDPLYPCSAVADKYLSACYELQTTAMLFLNKGDIAATARTCDGAPAAMREQCYMSLGRDISPVAQRDRGSAIASCELGTPRYQPWCFVGVARSVVNVASRPEDGVTFCRDVPAGANRLKCFEAVGDMSNWLGQPARQREGVCALVPGGPDQDACRFGAELTRRRPDGLPADTPEAPPAGSRLSRLRARVLAHLKS